MKFKQNDIVKSCAKLESGLRFGQEGIHACQVGPFSCPVFWSADEVAQQQITRDMIIEKRKELFAMLNDNVSDIFCKHCHMVRTKTFGEIDFGGLGHIDLAARTICNLRCNFCGYAIENSFAEAKYDALSILKEFKPEHVTWDSAVDFNGGEPSLLTDLEDYIEYFVSRRIRIFFMSNSVKFSKIVYDKLITGAIPWVCTSLDAGTPSTYFRTKKSTQFSQVLENLSRYAHAGSQGGGRLSVKYIFTKDNSGDDDVVGFTYAMLAIRPQKVWLTFDFAPLVNLPPDSDDFAGYDFSRQIAAYAKVFVLLKKHGIDAGHFTENHLANYSTHGRILLDRAKKEIERVEKEMDFSLPGLYLKDFRCDERYRGPAPQYFSINPLRIIDENKQAKQFSVADKRVVIVPTCYMSIDLLSDPEIRQAEIVGFIDRDTVLQNKKIQGINVYGYDHINSLAPDIILVASHQQHHKSILNKLTENVANGTRFFLFSEKEQKTC